MPQGLVRDLWALRLQKLRVRVSYESDVETDTESARVFSSQSESEGLSDSQSQSSRRSQKRNVKPGEETPSLSETLYLCYVGLLLLRIPVTVADISGWINQGDLTYYRASRSLPVEMRSRLPPKYQDLLEPRELLKPQSIHQGIVDTLKMYRVEFGMAIPPINTPLVLYRWIEGLALPLEVFAATQRLARILNFDGSFTAVGSKVILRYPEARLMALVVVATKLIFPSDDIERGSKSATDLSALSIDWNEWMKAHEADGSRTATQERLSFESAFNFTESDCVEAADETLDAYLDWYGHNIATEEVRERGLAGKDADFRKALFGLFPLHSGHATKKSEVTSAADDESGRKIRYVQSTLLSNRVVSTTSYGGETSRPGSFYRRFRREEDLSGPVKFFFEKTAMLAGLPLDGMVRAVYSTEQRLQKHEEAMRKTNRMG